MILGLVVLAVIGGLLAVGVLALGRGPDRGDGAEPGGGVRRFLVYGFLFATVVVTAIGVAGVIGELLPVEPVLGRRGFAGLARSLAFVVVGGPVAAAIWRRSWSALDDPHERRSPGWALYVALMMSVALLVGLVALVGGVSRLIGLEEDPAGRPLATGATWAAVWWWHRWTLDHPAKGPRRLGDLALVFGSGVGLVVGASAAGLALARLLSAAYDRALGLALAGGDTAVPILRALLWAGAGAVVWWWHWLHRRPEQGALRRLLVVVVGGLGGAAAALGAAGAIVHRVLVWIADRPEGGSAGPHFRPVTTLLATLLVGLLVWAHHRPEAAQGGPAYRHLMAGLGLVAAGSGLGVVVNALLSAFVTPLAGEGSRINLFLAGITGLLVGAPLWWRTWRPHRPVSDPAEVRSTTRRVYLVVFFGLTGVVALVSLLVVAFQVFRAVLEQEPARTVIDDSRAALGLLVAAGTVAGYHAAVWRRDRAAAPEPMRAVRRVILVTGFDPEPMVAAIEEATGASVTVWAAVGTGPGMVDPDRVAALLARHAAERVLVLAGPGDRLEVVPLRD